MTKNNSVAIVLAAIGLVGPAAAFAAPVTYDFSGTGKLCTYNGVGSVGTCVEGQAFTGSVTIDVLSAGPNGDDGHTDGKTYNQDLSGWVDSNFTIQWDGISFSPDVLPDMVTNWHDAQVLNDFSGVDALLTGEQYESIANGVVSRSSAGLYRYSYDKTWINDLVWDPLLGLAPGAGAINRVYFDNWTSVYDSEAQVSNRTGYGGEINLTSMTLRPAASVPEPGTLTLLGAGMAAIGFVRRRRRV